MRIRPEKTLFGCPLHDAALGPCPEKNEKYGIAKGIVAIGGVAVEKIVRGGMENRLFR